MGMQKRIKQAKRPTDVNELARHLVETSTGENIQTISASLSAYMAAIGRKGGQIGGRRRLETLSARKRRSIAKKAAQARWTNNQ
jgi:hypothetical protein